MVREQTAPVKRIRLMLRHIALPNEHGSWVFIFSPLLIGLFLGRAWTPATAALVVALMAGFLLRQPITVAVKVLSRRRPRTELPAALFWMGVYALLGLAGLVPLVALGFGYLGWLLLPALPVLGWHLWLVSRRLERRQALVEIAGSGVLALAAPAAYWVARGWAGPTGWLLWALVWLQSAGSIVYAYLRLEQRRLKAAPDPWERWRMALPALGFTSFTLLVTVLLAFLNVLPSLVPLAFAVQWLEALYGSFRPAVGARPTAIGIRQMLVSILFTVVFILTWEVI